MEHRYYQDNIIAIATPEQNGAIGIIRLSGKDARQILKKIFVRHSKIIKDVKPWRMYLGKLISKESVILDQCLAVFMPGPNSYSGEDLIELHCHGNLILMKQVIAEVLSYQNEFEIRGAEPGEFTKRAYLNGKMDLTQAESVHELVTARSEASLKLALSNIDGALKVLVEDLNLQLKRALSDIEASFEFPEEDIETYDSKEVLCLITRIIIQLKELQEAYHTSKLYDSGVSVVIVGQPNTGKSSLLNRLLVEDRAIVAEVPGTTRDVIEGSKIIDGIRFIFRDTAGLRETTDVIESTGMKKTNEWIQKSDLVLFVYDSLNELSGSTAHNDNHVLSLLNKADVLDYEGKKICDINSDELKKKFHVDFVISAKTGFGIAELEKALLSWVLCHYNQDNRIHVNARQAHKISVSLGLLNEVSLQLQSENRSEELLADKIRTVVLYLEEMIGVVSTDDVLTDIFSRFCIGK